MSSGLSFSNAATKCNDKSKIFVKLTGEPLKIIESKKNVNDCFQAIIT